MEDSVLAYLTLAQQLASSSDLRGASFNFSNETQMSARELVCMILRQMNSPLEPEIRNEASNEIHSQFLSAERARVRLGWKPRFSLEEGLVRTVAWYGDYFGVDVNLEACMAAVN